MFFLGGVYLFGFFKINLFIYFEGCLSFCFVVFVVTVVFLYIYFFIIICSTYSFECLYFFFVVVVNKVLDDACIISKMYVRTSVKLYS